MEPERGPGPHSGAPASSASQPASSPAPPHISALGLLPIPSRQEAVAPPTAGLPIASRQAQAPRPGCAAGHGQPAEQRYVVETITTPVRKGKRSLGRCRAGPRPGSSVAQCSAVAVDGANPSGTHLPRWAQLPAGCDPSPDSNVSSQNSSQLQALELDSNASFGFMPGVFAQSWHRKLSDSYNIVTCVGEGRSGAVFIVQHKHTEKFYACKFLRKVDHDPESLRREVSTLRKLDHPNIVRLFEVNEDKDTVFLLMELCHGGDLYEKIYEEQRLDEPTACMLAQQMLSALAYCHESGVVHRDVKPENFLLEQVDGDSPTIKLADFGIATSIRPAHLAGAASALHESRGSSSGAWPSFSDGEMPGSVLGSVPYMAPEVIMHQWKSLVKGAQGSTQVLAASDLWSCGVSLYVMLAGELPFGEDPQEICSGRPPDFSGAAWTAVSKEAIDLITRLMNPCVKERWTAKQALGHAWFREDVDEDSTPGDLTRGSGRLSPVLPSGYHDFAVAFVRNLRVWRQLPKLQRIAIIAIARKLEEQHDAHRVAQAAHALFGDAAAAFGLSARLSCERLAEALQAAVGGAGAEGAEGPEAAAGQLSSGGGPWTPATADSADPADRRRPLPGAVATSPSPLSAAFPSAASVSSASPGSAPARLQGGTTRTGLHVRRRMRLLARGLSGLAEETPTATPTPGSCSTPSLSEGLFGRLAPGASSRLSSALGATPGGDDLGLVSLTELRYLASALDGQKDGFVDYTLLLASLLPAEVCSDEGRIAEVFELFDLQKRGSVGPRDFYMALLGDGSARRRWRSKEASLWQLVEMIAEFDFDGDGRLDFAEFRAMVVRGNSTDEPMAAAAATVAAATACSSRAVPV